MEGREDRAYNRLQANSCEGRCGLYICSLDELHRLTLYNNFEYRRLERKHEDMLKLYEECGQSWNETLFVSVMTRLGCALNKYTFKELAHRVRYNTLLRERGVEGSAEAILLGASGILELYPKDAYILKLNNEAAYYLRKHKIEPLHYSDWSFDKVYPINHPAIRLAQAATLFSKNALFFDRAIECETLSDVVSLFGVEASDYWTTHYTPGVVSKYLDYKVKRVGVDKCNVIGINVIVSMQYAYGQNRCEEHVSDRAERLIQNLKAESNYIINKWCRYGVKPRNAFETQALIHMYEEYCKSANCRKCPLGQRAVKNLGWIEGHK